MAKLPPIMATAQAHFPPSANKGVRIENAWHPDKSTTGKGRPEYGGFDGWVTIGRYATRELAEKLIAEGYTWVNLVTSGCANSRKDVRLDTL